MPFIHSNLNWGRYLFVSMWSDYIFLFFCLSIVCCFCVCHVFVNILLSLCLSCMLARIDRYHHRSQPLHFCSNLSNCVGVGLWLSSINHHVNVPCLLCFFCTLCCMHVFVVIYVCYVCLFCVFMYLWCFYSVVVYYVVIICWWWWMPLRLYRPGALLFAICFQFWRSVAARIVCSELMGPRPRATRSLLTSVTQVPGHVEPGCPHWGETGQPAKFRRESLMCVEYACCFVSL